MTVQKLRSELGLLLLALVPGCGESEVRSSEVDEGERSGGVAVVCATALPEPLNAFVSADLSAADLNSVLFSPLVLYDSAGGIRPYLAEEWEWLDEHRRLRLRLRPDMRWHDGQRVTAEDVAWTVLAAADSTYAYLNWDDVSVVSDAVVRDSVTVELLFSEPFSAGLEPFTQLPILPRHLLDSIPAAQFARAEYHRAPVGSGPFRYAGRAADGALQFDRFPEFPEPLGRAHLDRFVLRAVPEPSSMIIEMQTGNVDLCVSGAAFATQVEAAQGLEAIVLPPTGVQQIQLATGKPPLDDARVRRAISAALRRADLAAVISPLARPARTYLPGDAERWLGTAELQPDADSALAAALLDSAGWNTIGADGIRRNAAGTPLSFEIAAPQPLEITVTVVQSQLRSVGILVRPEFMEGASFVSMVYDENARAPAIAVSIFPDKFVVPDPAGQLHSEGGFNFTGWGDAESDSLIDRLSAVIDDDERQMIYQELQRRVAREVPIVYTVFFPRVVAVGPRLEGVETDLNGPFATVGRWWIPPEERRGARRPRTDTAPSAGEGRTPS